MRHPISIDARLTRVIACLLGTLVATAAPGADEGLQLVDPVAVAVDAHDNVLVVERSSARLVFLTKDLELIGRYGKAQGVELTRPVDAAVDSNGRFIVADAGAHRLITLDDQFGQLSRFGEPGAAEGQFGTLAAVAVDGHDRIYTLESDPPRVQVFSPLGRLLGSLKLEAPLANVTGDGTTPALSSLDITQGNLVLVATSAGVAVCRFDFEVGRGRVLRLRRSFARCTDVAALPEGRIAAASATDKAVVVADLYGVVEADTRLAHSPVSATQASSALDIVPVAVAVQSSGDLVVLDAGGRRVFAIPHDNKSSRPYSMPAAARVVQLAGRRAHVAWSTVGRSKSRLYYGARPAVGLSFAESNRRVTAHRMELEGLTPGKRYSLRQVLPWKVWPGDELVGRMLVFVAKPRTGEMTYLRIPLLVVIETSAFMSTESERLDESEAPPPLPMTELDRIKEECRRAARFVWIHSGCAVEFAMTFVVVEEPFGIPKGCAVPNEWLARWLEEAELRREQFQHVVELRARHISRAAKLVISQPPEGGLAWHDLDRGVSVLRTSPDETTARCTAGMLETAIVVLADAFERSGRLDAWPLPFDFSSETQGVQVAKPFAASAALLHAVPREAWLMLNAGRVEVVLDRDGDTIPDYAPDLPYDERRFGSSPTATDTDGDGMLDIEELRGGLMIERALGERFGGGARHLDPANADTDGDGLPDGLDTLPLYSCPDTIAARQITLDGRLRDREWTRYAEFNDGEFTASLSLAWDRDALYIGAVTQPAARLSLSVAPLKENDRLSQELLADLSITPPERTGDAPDISARITLDGQRTSPAPPEAIAAISLMHGDEMHLELALKRDLFHAAWLAPGKRVGVKVGFSTSTVGPTEWLTVFEPDTFAWFRLVTAQSEAEDE